MKEEAFLNIYCLVFLVSLGLLMFSNVLLLFVFLMSKPAHYVDFILTDSLLVEDMNAHNVHVGRLCR